MKFHELHIKNFKGFEETTFRFNEQFTLIIGNNATGKTSILDALSVAISCFLYGIKSSFARTIKGDEIRQKLISGQPKPQFPLLIEAKGKIDGKILNWKREYRGNDGDDEEIKRIKPTHKDYQNIAEIAHAKLLESRRTEGVTFPLIAYHGVCRLCAEHGNRRKVDYWQQGEGVMAGYSNCLSPKSSSNDFISWYKTYEDEIRKFDQPEDKLLLQVFNQAISALVPQWEDMAFSFKAGDLTGIFTNDNGEKQKLFFNQLSDGFRGIIGLAADLAYRCIQLNPHLGSKAITNTPGIVLIDEIDLHLHPKWQRTIVADLKRVFPNVQFIATSHSPFIIQSLKTNELIILDESIELDNDPYRKSIEEIAEEEMNLGDVKRSKLFQEKEQLAASFFSLLSKPLTEEKIKRESDIQEKLKELEMLYGDDPAFIALLKAESKTKNW